MEKKSPSFVWRLQDPSKKGQNFLLLQKKRYLETGFFLRFFNDIVKIEQAKEFVRLG